jgi:hypothetical protein
MRFIQGKVKHFAGKPAQAADFCQRQAARVYFFENILQPVGHFRLFSKRSTRAEILFQKRIPYGTIWHQIMPQIKSCH